MIKHVSAHTLHQAHCFISSACTYIKEVCKNVSKGNTYHTEEMTQMIYLALLEMKEEKIIHLINNNQLRYYVIGMITNQLKSVTSDFYRKYRRTEANETEFENWHSKHYEFNYDKFEQLELIDSFLKEKNNNASFKMPNGNSYEVELFELYYKDNMSYGDISIKTGIPKTSIYNSVKLVKEELILFLYNNYPETIL